MMAMLSRRRFSALLGAIPLFPIALANKALAEAKTHYVAIRKFEFEPAEITVVVGDIVEWTNEDIAPHTATEFEDTDWDTGELSKGQAGAVTFSTPGESEYFCVFHPHMRGRILVKAV